MFPTKGFELKNFVVITFALIWSLGQMGQIFGLGYKFLFLDAVLLIALVFVFRTKKVDVEMLRPFVIFWAVLAISFLVNIFGKNQNQVIVAASYLLRMAGVLGLFAGLQKFKTVQIEKGISFGLIVFLVLALCQYLLFPDTRSIKLLGYDDHYYRAIGTLLDPNLAAVIYIWAFYWFENRYKNSKVLQVLATVLLALSFSRSGYLAFGISLGMHCIKNRSIMQLVWAGVLALAIILAPKPFGEGVNLARTYSIDSRIENVKSGVVESGNFVFGNGFNFVTTSGQSVYTNRSSGVDNSYVFVWATTGIVGVIALGYLFWKLYPVVASQSWAIGTFGALLIHGLVNNSLFQLQISVLAVVSLGYLWRVAHHK